MEIRIRKKKKTPDNKVEKSKYTRKENTLSKKKIAKNKVNI